MKKVNLPYIVTPAPFPTVRKVGDRVWFTKKGVWIEGKVAGYFCEMFPSEENSQRIKVSNVNYAVQFWIPNPQRNAPEEPEFISQVELLEAKSMVDSLEELIELWKQQNVFRLPDE